MGGAAFDLLQSVYAHAEKYLEFFSIPSGKTQKIRSLQLFETEKKITTEAWSRVLAGFGPFGPSLQPPG